MSMNGKIVIVTGANAGIGKATALGLSKLGASVVMIARSRERGEAAQVQIKKESGNENVHLLLADLSSQAEIRRLAQEFTERFPALHVLINNAGIIPQKWTETVDGLEMQFAVNHMAYFLLTDLLLDILKKSAPARIVNVSSGVHTWDSLDYDDLQSKRSYRPADVYARTKLANVLFTYELARRLQGTGVTANSLHPGVIVTKLYNDYAGRPSGPSFTGDSPESGARTSIYLASAPEIEGISGRYFSNEREARAYPDDPLEAKRLWDASVALIKS